MHRLIQRYGKGLTAVLLGVTAFWLLLLVVLPEIIMVNYSLRPFLPVAEIGGPGDGYTLANYATFFVSWIHIKVFLITVFVSCLVTAICLAAAYPVAYFMAKTISAKAAATLFMLALVLGQPPGVVRFALRDEPRDLACDGTGMRMRLIRES